MRIQVWVASRACRLRHPCPITETCWQDGQTRTIRRGLPSASFHGINTITAVAKAPSGSPLERCPVGRGASSVLCKRPSFSFHVPDRLNGPERRVGLCGDATRAPTQGPGFREGERSSPLGPGILAQSEKSRGFGGSAPIPETLLFRFFHRRPASPARRPVGGPRTESRSVVRPPSNPGPASSMFGRCAPTPCTAASSPPPRSGTNRES